MDIVSYNVNGIRAAIGKGLLNWMESRKADVYCFQETKAEKSQVDLSSFELFGYNSYWFSAQKKGYSGVAIFTKHKPKNVAYGFGNDDYDEEGRIVQVDFDDVSVIHFLRVIRISMSLLGKPSFALNEQWLRVFAS